MTVAAAVADFCVVTLEVATAVGDPSNEERPLDCCKEARLGELGWESVFRETFSSNRGPACSVSDAEASDREVELVAPSGKSHTADGSRAVVAVETMPERTTAMVGAPSTAARRSITDDEPAFSERGGTDNG